MDVIGHRGCRVAEYPENTLVAVAAALNAGAQGVEVDVRLTGDGVLVCCHDPRLGRVSGRPLVVANAGDADVNRVVLPGGHRVPRLSEMLALIGDRARLVLDVKSDPRRPAATALAVAALVRHCRWGATDQLTVSSFDPVSLDVVRCEAPAVRRALIGGRGTPASTCLAQTVIRGHHDAHPHVSGLLADPLLPLRARDRGVGVAGWTVNQPRQIAILQAAGVDSIITDDPTMARETLAATLRTPT